MNQDIKNLQDVANGMASFRAIIESMIQEERTRPSTQEELQMVILRRIQDDSRRDFESILKFLQDHCIHDESIPEFFERLDALVKKAADILPGSDDDVCSVVVELIENAGLQKAETKVR